MAYDGKLLRRAQAKYEEDRSRHEEEMARRREAIVLRQHRLRDHQGIRTGMIRRFMGIGKGHTPVQAAELAGKLPAILHKKGLLHTAAVRQQIQQIRKQGSAAQRQQCLGQSAQRCQPAAAPVTKNHSVHVPYSLSIGQSRKVCTAPPGLMQADAHAAAARSVRSDSETPSDR